MPTLLGRTDGTDSNNTGLENADGTITIRRRQSLTYIVLSDTTADGVNEIEATTGIPKIGAIVGGLFVTRLRSKEVSTCRHPVTGVLCQLWETVAELDSNFDASGGIATPGTSDPVPPEYAKPTVRWATESEDELVERDVLTKERIENTAGTPILTTRRRHYPVLQIQRYEVAPFDPALLLTYPEHVNDATFWGAPPGSALMASITSEERQVDGRTLVYVTYRVKFKIKESALTVINNTGNPDAASAGWYFMPLNQGTHYRKMINGNLSEDLFPHTDVNGNLLTVNLTATGEKADIADSALHLVFATYEMADFSNLNIDVSDIIIGTPP